MGDVIFIVATIAFFAICALYVNWCDRIIGPDDFGTVATDDLGPDTGTDTDTDTDMEVAA